MAKRLHRKEPMEPLPSHPFMAWRYDCPCGIVAYSFDGTPTIRDSVGHEVTRGARVICNSGKFYEHCPRCGTSGGAHSCERRDEMFYVASCPRGN